MLESKGLDADLVTSLPRLLEKYGLEQVRCEKLTARDGENYVLSRQVASRRARAEHVSTLSSFADHHADIHIDLGSNLDGASEGSAAMYAFFGRKRPAPAADIGV